MKIKLSELRNLLKETIKDELSLLHEAQWCQGLSLNVDFSWSKDEDIEFLKTKNYNLLAKELKIGAKRAGMNIVDSRLTEYGDKNPEYGFTYLIVLGQSHVIVHTWPEEKQLNMDAFTCGNEGDPYKIFQHIKDRFKPEHTQI